jgi:hypothetical protein
MEPILTPHEFVPGEPLDIRPSMDAPTIDVTEWCARCGWHKTHELHDRASERSVAVAPSTAKE